MSMHVKNGNKPHRLPEEHEMVERSIHRQHVAMATLSAVISGLVHILLLLYVLFVPLDLASFSDREKAPEAPREQMRIQSVDPESWIDTVRSIQTPGEGTFTQPQLAESAAELTLPPESMAFAPAPVPSDAAVYEGPAVTKPSKTISPGEWQPRQEILDIRETIAPAALPGLERQLIPEISRVADAPDVVLPVFTREISNEAARVALDIPAASILGSSAADTSGLTPADVANQPGRGGDAGDAATSVLIDEPLAQKPADQFEEKTEEITELKPLDNLLKSSLQVYYDRKESEYGYFRLVIDRVDESVLPVIPKDILLVQDCSASIAEQRLYFCRKGLKSMLNHIQPRDRFNVMRFRDTAEFCFDDWTAPGSETRARAESFIDGMQSRGETDILNSLLPISQVTRTPGRPVVVLLVTDGLATAGVTRSTDIIGEFTTRNAGETSVFTMGTMSTANSYLLDILSYCNRGDSRLTEGGRWGIPEVMDALMQELSQPVLEAVSFRLSKQSPCEIYPWQTMNLYSDRSLILYGKFPRNMPSFTFQARGRAGDILCDMIFTMNIRDGEDKGDKDIRENWARQKVYTLIGEYARSQDPAVLTEMDRTARQYRIKIPYRKRF